MSSTRQTTVVVVVLLLLLLVEGAGAGETGAGGANGKQGPYKGERQHKRGSGSREGHETRPGPSNEPHRSSMKKVRFAYRAEKSQVLARAPPRNGANAPPPVPPGPWSIRRGADSIGKRSDWHKNRHQQHKRRNRRQDGDMEMDGDMAVNSIKTKTLSIQINTQSVSYLSVH